MSGRHIPVVQRSAHRRPPLEGHGHGDEDGGAEAHVVERVDEPGEEVDVGDEAIAESSERSMRTEM